MSETEHETKQEKSKEKAPVDAETESAEANGKETVEKEDSQTTIESKESVESVNDESKIENKNDDTEDKETEEDEDELPHQMFRQKKNPSHKLQTFQSAGLLEQPIAIMQEKRERKKVARFSYDDAPAPSAEKKKLEIKEGKGKKLGEHPRVEWQLSRNKGEDLKIIHKLFFGVFGDAHHCKKNIRNFSGFTFDKDSNEYEKKEEYLGRFTLDNLKWAMTVCDVENKKGKKDDLIDSLLDWCLEPKASGKPIPKKRAKGEKQKSKGKRKPRKSSDTSKNTSNETISSDDLSSDSDSDNEVSGPKETKSPSATKKKTPQKRKSTNASPKKIAKIKIGQSKKDNTSSDESDDDAPLKKKKSSPTNAQIRKSVEKILKGADLEEITMKAVCLKVYEMYPDFDLSDRKPFIKETVKKIIS